MKEDKQLIYRFIFYLSCGHYGGKRKGTKIANCVRNEKLTCCCNLQQKIILKENTGVGVQGGDEKMVSIGHK